MRGAVWDCRADIQKGRYGRVGGLVWLVADHPHPHDNVEGLRAVTGSGRTDERHALADQLELLLPVIQRGLPVACQIILPSESLCEPPRLRMLRVRLRPEAHQHKGGEEWLRQPRVPRAERAIGVRARTCLNFCSTSVALTGGTTFAYRWSHPPKMALAS